VTLMQLVTIEDSCLLRCIRRPSTLSPKLPAEQSTAATGEAAKPGEGAPRRRAGIAEVPTRSKYDGCDDCYSLFARAARLYPTNYCLGWRTTLPSGNAGPFTWLTYKETHAQVLQLASGVAQLGLKAKGTFGMYASNCARFQIATLGAPAHPRTRPLPPTPAACNAPHRRSRDRSPPPLTALRSGRHDVARPRVRSDLRHARRGHCTVRGQPRRDPDPFRGGSQAA
jgi:hypothetical protein